MNNLEKTQPGTPNAIRSSATKYHRTYGFNASTIAVTINPAEQERLLIQEALKRDQEQIDAIRKFLLQ
jgi:hypothetical protein